MHVVLIPSFEPDARLVALVRALRAAAPTRPVLVVDDGSGEAYEQMFADAAGAGAVVARHASNRGKGAALRTGFAWVADRYPGAAVVTADADGQHSPADIERVAARTEELNTPGADTRPVLVLGARSFTGDDVPARSRLGNTATRGIYRAVTGTPLRDTQTGLRGIPAGAVAWLLQVRGDRFEYEFRVLLQARRAGVDIAEEPIATIYTDANASSHFRPVLDSLRVYAPLGQFAASAFLSFLIDTVTLLLLFTTTGWLFFSVVAARLVSATANFAVNRGVVFRGARDVPVRAAAARYFSLAGLLLAANYGVITALTDAGIPLLPAKILTEVTLFAVSFAVQRAIVFAPGATSASTRAGEKALAGMPAASAPADPTAALSLEHVGRSHARE